MLHVRFKRELGMNPDEVDRLTPEQIMTKQAIVRHEKEQEAELLATKISKIFGGKT
jgi:hypothetical protein